MIPLDSSSSSLNIDSKPASVPLQMIVSEEQFDRIMGEAQQLDKSLIIVWMTTWCRKCIYLKPKLEKMAADYYPRVGFFCIDVNTVPYKLDGSNVLHVSITTPAPDHYPCRNQRNLQMKMPAKQVTNLYFQFGVFLCEIQYFLAIVFFFFGYKYIKKQFFFLLKIQKKNT
ncbi:hypothetical protein MKW94_013108 [Papaver nudicaule]|uniref:Thioredoxin domain-containing protein n=1 Tax=Papaver nudicaule TaxID=74823 RepID=A0AA41V5H5_PAPNU|nr:hypothetical protein [Papaver nudicaule]